MTRYLAALAASSLLVACTLPFPAPTPPPNRFEPALGPDHEEDLPVVSIDGVAGAIFHTLHYLDQLDSIGTPVLNGSEAFRVELKRGS